MWQRFTERARLVILIGQEEAGKMNSAHVGTEHLLLGLARESDGIATQILHNMGATSEALSSQIESHVPLSDTTNTTEPKLTPKAKRVLELAADEARRMRHNYIGTEHLLLGLLREKDGLAATILRHFGLNLEQTRTYILEYLSPQKSQNGSSYPAAMSTTAATRTRRTEGSDSSSYSWQRFTDRVRIIVLMAQEEAMKLGNDHVGTEHLLLGLIQQQEGVAAHVLQKLGASPTAMRQHLEAQLKNNSAPVSLTPMQTPVAKRILELASDEALLMEDNHIGSGHLLLALSREDEGLSLSATVLSQSGINRDNAVAVLEEYLNAQENDQ